MAKRLTADDRKSTLANQQADIFQPLAQQGDFAELCSALYERELQQLSQVDDMPTAALQRRLASLPHYIRHAAHGCLNAAKQSPLKLDVQKCQLASSSANESTFTGYLSRKANFLVLKACRVRSGCAGTL